MISVTSELVSWLREFSLASHATERLKRKIQKIASEQKGLESFILFVSTDEFSRFEE